MKIILSVGSKIPVGGYVNVDPFADPQDSRFAVGDVSTLDWVCDDGEAEEIVVDKAFELFPLQQVDSLIQNWVKKLGHGGRITFVLTDLFEVGKLLHNRSITLTDANRLLLGEQDRPFAFKRTLLSASELVDSLKGKGLKIIRASTEGTMGLVIGERQ